MKEKILIIDGETYKRNPHYNALATRFEVFRAASINDVQNMRHKLNEFSLIFVSKSVNSFPHFVDHDITSSEEVLYNTVLHTTRTPIVMWSDNEAHFNKWQKTWKDKQIRQELFLDDHNFFLDIAKGQLCAWALQ